MDTGSSNVGLLASLAAVLAALGSVITVIKFWTGFSDRIVIANNKADDAMQEAAEAKNEYKSLREVVTEMNHDLDERIDKRSREYGEGLTAIRQHVTELAFFVRDKFVQKEDFISSMREIKEGQARVEKKIDDMRERLASR